MLQQEICVDLSRILYVALTLNFWVRSFQDDNDRTNINTLFLIYCKGKQFFPRGSTEIPFYLYHSFLLLHAVIENYIHYIKESSILPYITVFTSTYFLVLLRMSSLIFFHKRVIVIAKIGRNNEKR